MSLIETICRRVFLWAKLLCKQYCIKMVGLIKKIGPMSWRSSVLEEQYLNTPLPSPPLPPRKKSMLPVKACHFLVRPLNVLIFLFLSLPGGPGLGKFFFFFYHHCDFKNSNMVEERVWRATVVALVPGKKDSVLIVPSSLGSLLAQLRNMCNKTTLDNSTGTLGWSNRTKH